MATYASFAVCHPARPKRLGTGNSRLSTFGTVAVTKPAAARRKKTTEVISGSLVANRNVCRTAPNETVAGSGEATIAPFAPCSSFFLNQ